MTTDKTIEKLRSEIKRCKDIARYARRRANSAEASEIALREDRDAYRAWVVQLHGWLVGWMTDHKTPSLPWLQGDLAKLLNRVKPICWPR